MRYIFFAIIRIKMNQSITIQIKMKLINGTWYVDMVYGKEYMVKDIPDRLLYSSTLYFKLLNITLVAVVKYLKHSS